MTRIQELSKKAATLPKGPGCYLMKDRYGNVIYVGKAKNLKSRVGSYFTQATKSPKTQILVGHIRDFEFIMTGSDAEAFVLENNLIKKHTPKYNVRLKDDKSYPYVVCNSNDKFPRLLYQRRPKRKKGTLVFGPFATGSNVSEVLRVVIKSFKLRDCTDREFNSREEPCLLFQMKQCTAPCVDLITEETYKKDLELALDIFQNKGKKALPVLEDQMQYAASLEKYEKAAVLRDNIEVINTFVGLSAQKNAEVYGLEENLDIFAYHSGDLEVDISLYMIRNGLLLGHKNFNFVSMDKEEELQSELVSFIHQYYTSSHDILPQKAIIDLPVDLLSDFEKALDLSLKGLENYSKIELSAPSKKYQSLMDVTKKNAFETQRVRIGQQESYYLALNKLQEFLGLKERPRILECYDVAIWQGKSPTASKVVFHDGRADKKNYRHYHLKELPEGNNDFAMMKEILQRRLESGQLPDLFVVDGGISQVNVFLKVLKEAEIDIPVVGIAKARTLKGNQYASKVNRSDERLIIPGRSNPIVLSKIPALFRLLVQMRDEAHRFSRRLHHNAEKKRVLSSWVDQVPGIGPKTKQRILRSMSLPVNELKEKTPAFLQEHFRVSYRIAQNMKRVLEDMDEC